MARHRREPGVDLSGLARTDPVNRRADVVEDPPPRHFAQHAERLCQRIEQHLEALERISPDGEGTAIRQPPSGDRCGLTAPYFACKISSPPMTVSQQAGIYQNSVLLGYHLTALAWIIS